MKKIILSLLIIFISLPAPSWAIPFYGAIYDKFDETPLIGAAALYTDIKNDMPQGVVSDADGFFTIEDINSVQNGEITISMLGYNNTKLKISNIETTPTNRHSIYMVPDNELLDGTLVEAKGCQKYAEKLNATDMNLNQKSDDIRLTDCQPTNCKDGYSLNILSEGHSIEVKENGYGDVFYHLVREKNESIYKAQCVEKCPCGKESKKDENPKKGQGNICKPWAITECSDLPAGAKSGERICDGNKEDCKIISCIGSEHNDLAEYILDKKNNKCVSQVGQKCDPTTQIAHAKSYKFYQDPNNDHKVFCGVNKCKNYATKSDDNKTCTVKSCTQSEETKLKQQGATQTAKTVTARGKAVCIPTACKAPKYELHEDDDAPENNKCVSLVGQKCYDITDGYESHADIDAGGLYGYDSDNDKLFCYPVNCTQNYTLDKKTKKCVANKCPCGQKQVGNECVEWNETDRLCGVTPDGVKSAERACDGNQEYCKIISCIGSEYGDYSLYELINPDSPSNKCKSRVDQKCKPQADHAKDGKLRESAEGNKLFCAITECEGSYVPSDDGTQCEKSGCTEGDSDAMKNANAKKWKWDNKKNQCIPTKCECGYGDTNGKPINDKCDVKWSWDDTTPPEGTKKECEQDNASEAYMDCDASGKAYCRVHKCDEDNGYNIAGNQCVADACDPDDYSNSIYVKRVGSECKIQECKTGYDVNKEGTECVARDDLLSEEDSKARIKELQANEDALKENEQKLENKLLGAAGIAGAGIGGQMLATGIAQQRADAEAERDMTAYLATFKCKYGNKMVDSGNKEIELPGANDQKYSEMYRKYKELASELKISKASLGMKPGIESEEILDISNLYSNGNIGGADGAYTSLADALSGDSDAQEALKKQKNTALGLTIGGGVLAAGTVAGTVVGNVKAHKDAPKNQAKEINEKYDEMRGTYQEAQ